MTSQPTRLLLLFFLATCFTACDAPRKEFSITVNGVTTASIDDNIRVRNVDPFESNLENPIITGTVRVGNHLEETNHNGPGYCCRRLIMNSTGNVGNLMTSLYLKLGTFSDRGPNKVIYDYWATSISLPADHSAIDLSIQVGNDTYIHSTVKLKDDVLVIPVYAHVFTRGIDRSQIFTEQQLAACFDLPNFTTSGTSVNNPNGPDVYVTTYTSPNYAPPDTIWKQANIQFRLMAVEYIDNPALNAQILSSNAQSPLVSGYHAAHNLNVPGFHIYFGGDALSLESEGQTIGYSPRCDVNTTANSSNHIALEFGASPFALSHEIGHMLGLGHVDGTGSANACRAGLLGNAGVEGNLMKERGFGYKLSQGQIAHARLVACKYLQLWNMPNDACANP